MIAISSIDRVMYLYHYFTPLLFSFILVAFVSMNMHRIGRMLITDTRRTYGIMILAGLIVVSYQFYRPFSNYEPLTKEQVERRAIVPIWELTCIGCDKKSMLVVPTK
jgi:dolichyl-phosphate-mannose--protein O-mannosyl transferase